jgi:hypothetical protein
MSIDDRTIAQHDTPLSVERGIVFKPTDKIEERKII